MGAAPWRKEVQLIDSTRYRTLKRRENDYD